MRNQPMAKLGPNTSTNRTVGSVQGPSPTMAGAELTTEVSTFFARPGADSQPVVIYNGDRQSARVILTLETAGPVIVGTKQQLYPITAGKGERLETNVPFAFSISKGNRLWVATTAISRIKVTIEPIPWAEQIVGLLTAILGGGRK